MDFENCDIDAEPCDASPGRAACRCRAFTIVELLVVVGVVMILVGLALPTLALSREFARQSVCAQQLGQHVKVVHAYAADNRDAFPFLWPRARVAPVYPGMPNELPPWEPDHYEAISGLWHVPMLEAYGSDPFNRALICPSQLEAAFALRDKFAAKEGVAPSRVGWTLDYRMSMAMFLDSRALDPETPSFERKYYVGQCLSAVMFPSSKAAILEGVPSHDARYIEAHAVLFPNSRNFAAVDGAVAFRSTADMVPSVCPPQLVKPGGEPLYREANKGNYTPRGVAGRDW